METFSALLAICAENSPVPGEFPAHRPVTCGALMFSLKCVWINGCENNRGAGDLRRYRTHYDVIVMSWMKSVKLAETCPKQPQQCAKRIHISWHAILYRLADALVKNDYDVLFDCRTRNKIIHWSGLFSMQNKIFLVSAQSIITVVYEVQGAHLSWHCIIYSLTAQ